MLLLTWPPVLLIIPVNRLIVVVFPAPLCPRRLILKIYKNLVLSKNITKKCWIHKVNKKLY